MKIINDYPTPLKNRIAFLATKDEANALYEAVISAMYKPPTASNTKLTSKSSTLRQVKIAMEKVLK